MRGKFVAAGTAVLCAALWSAAPASASTSWRVQQVPAPANSAAQLRGVSCPATGVCTAVGYSVDKTTHVQQTLAERWAGGQWAIQATPSPGAGFNQFTAVSCLSATDCMAVGLDSTATAPESTLTEHWDGTSWTVIPSPDPTGVTVAELDAVSCASPDSCTATGLYDTNAGGRPHEAPLAEHWDGTSWAIQNVPLPAGATGAGLDGGVSCPSATDCTAVGAVAISGLASNTEPLAERWNGTRWTVQVTVNPAGSYNTGFSGVSCTSAARCTAVGGYLANGSTASSLVERWDGTDWTVQTDAASSELMGVSCTSGTSCTAIGQGASGGVAEHWDGTSWTLQPMPVPRQSTRGDNILGLSCRSATTCTSVGWYGRQAHPLAEHE